MLYSMQSTVLYVTKVQKVHIQIRWFKSLIQPLLFENENNNTTCISFNDKLEKFQHGKRFREFFKLR